MDTNTYMKIGVDLAKDVFQLYGVDEETGEAFNKQMSRKRFCEFLVNRPPCLIGMEACGGSHYWARTLKAWGHEVKIMPGHDVKAFRSGNKDDASDARAIWAALNAGTTREVVPKEVWQQELTGTHKLRENLVKRRTAVTNQMRGLLSEFGIVFPKGAKAFREHVPDALYKLREMAPTLASLLEEAYDEYMKLNERISKVEKVLADWADGNEACRRLQEIDGVGLITATGVIAYAGDGIMFRSGREMAACFGVSPIHSGSGGRVRILGMGKHGNGYIRRMLVHCARAVVTRVKNPPSIVTRLKKKKRNINVIVGAVANKLCRIIWSMLVHGTRYVKNHISVMCVGTACC